MSNVNKLQKQLDVLVRYYHIALFNSFIRKNQNFVNSKKNPPKYYFELCFEEGKEHYSLQITSFPTLLTKNGLNTFICRKQYTNHLLYILTSQY